MLPSCEKTRSRVQWPPPRSRPPPGNSASVLRLGARHQIAIVVREAHDAVGIADIKPLGIGAGRIENDAEGQVQTARKDRDLLGGSVPSYTAKDFDLAAGALSEKEVAVGCGPQQARVVQIEA